VYCQALQPVSQTVSTRVSTRGLHSFRFQLNLSSSVHRVTQLYPECVLNLLMLSSNVNECKPLVSTCTGPTEQAGGDALGGSHGLGGEGAHPRHLGVTPQVDMGSKT
jgi:hypothetical protein